MTEVGGDPFKDREATEGVDAENVPEVTEVTDAAEVQDTEEVQEVSSDVLDAIDDVFDSGEQYERLRSANDDEYADLFAYITRRYSGFSEKARGLVNERLETELEDDANLRERPELAVLAKWIKEYEKFSSGESVREDLNVIDGDIDELLRQLDHVDRAIGAAAIIEAATAGFSGLEKFGDLGELEKERDAADGDKKEELNAKVDAYLAEYYKLKGVLIDLRDHLADIDFEDEDVEAKFTEFTRDLTETSRADLIKLEDLKAVVDESLVPLLEDIRGMDDNFKLRRLGYLNEAEALETRVNTYNPDDAESLEEIVQRSLEGVEKNDHAVSKNMIMAFMAKRDPEMTTEELEKEATIELMNGISLVRSNADLSEAASKDEKLRSLLQKAGMKEHVLNFSFEDANGNQNTPFKRVEMSQVEDAEKMKGLVDKRGVPFGFHLLAASESINGVSETKSRELKDHLKKLVAKMQGLSLDTKEGAKSAEDEVEARLNFASGMVVDYLEEYNKSKNERRFSEVVELNRKARLLKKQVANEAFSPRVFAREWKALVKETKAKNMMHLVDFGQTAFLAQWVNSEHFGAMNGKVNDWADKQKRVAWERLKMAGEGAKQFLWGAVKYPVMATVGRPYYWLSNRSRRKWNEDEISVGADISKDMKRFRAGRERFSTGIKEEVASDVEKKRRETLRDEYNDIRRDIDKLNKKAKIKPLKGLSSKKLESFNDLRKSMRDLEGELEKKPELERKTGILARLSKLKESIN